MCMMNCSLLRAARMGYVKNVFAYCKKWGWKYLFAHTAKEPLSVGLTRNLNGTGPFGFYNCDEFTLIKFAGIYLRIGESNNSGG